MGRRMLTGLAVVLAAGCCLGGSAAFAQTAAAQAADPPSATTRAVNEAARAAAPFQERRDYDFAARGFVATRKDPLIRAADGRVVWDLNTFSFVDGPAPDTVNPSLWRHAQVLSRAGLFKVSDRIWQVRGFDIANVTFVKGDKGWIVIDPLTADETARAAYDLVTEQLGKRPVSAIIYTHSHIDHFGGAGGILPFAVPGVPILAPQGFTEAAVGENVIAGPAMARRAIYQFGLTQPKGPTGSMGSGIGMAVAPGTQGLVPPNREIAKTGTEIVLDGVKLRFQVTPGTEAPAEMNIGFPDWKVADLAENANVTQHNILTPRGAVVRNAKAWAQGLTEAIDFFAGAEVMITSHGWPRFGAAEITDFLGKHRDAYAYLHDQTVRLMNQGLTGDEIAAKLMLPKALQQEWYDRPYYGSLSFNARAVYQFYMGWYDGNPVHLAPLPPEPGGRIERVEIGAHHRAEIAGRKRLVMVESIDRRAHAGRAFLRRLAPRHVHHHQRVEIAVGFPRDLRLARGRNHGGRHGLGQNGGGRNRECQRGSQCATPCPGGALRANSHHSSPSGAIMA